MSNRRGHSFNNDSRISFRLRAVSNREFHHKDPSIINIPRPNFNIVIKRGMDVDLSFRDFSCDENPLLKKSRYCFFENFNFSKEGELGIPSLDSLAVENVAQYADLQALAKIKSTAEYAIKIAKDDAKAESISEATKTEKITARNKISRFLRYSTAEDVSMFMDFIVESIQDADAAFKSTIQKFLLSRTSNESQRSLIIDRVSGQEGGMHQKATEDEKLK